MNNNVKNILLVLIIVLVLAVGVFAVKKVLGKGGKKKNSKNNERTGDEKEQPPVEGRDDPRNSFSEKELQRNTIKNKGIKPEYEAVLADSLEGKKIIEKIVKDIQKGNDAGLTKIRGTEEIGRELMNIPNFSEEANAAIRAMFGRMPGVEADNMYTWPIYGKYESSGAALRRELEAFLAIPIHKLHLGPGREENAGWIPSVGLNIMMLTNVNRLPTIFTIRGNWATGDDRLGLINYMRINRFTGTHERFMAKMVHGRSPYKAYGVRELAKVLLAAMDRLDAVCYRYATKKAVGDGLVIEQAVASNNSPNGSGGRGRSKKMNMSVSTKAGAKRV